MTAIDPIYTPTYINYLRKTGETDFNRVDLGATETIEVTYKKTMDTIAFGSDPDDGTEPETALIDFKEITCVVAITGTLTADTVLNLTAKVRKLRDIYGYSDTTTTKSELLIEGDLTIPYRWGDDDTGLFSGCLTRLTFTKNAGDVSYGYIIEFTVGKFDDEL